MWKKSSRRTFLSSVVSGILALGPSTVPSSAAENGDGIAQSIKRFNDPVSLVEMEENRELALKKYVAKGGKRPKRYGFTEPSTDSGDVIAHVAMYDAEKGLREFLGMGASPKDNGEIRQSAADFIREVSGTQTVTDSTTTESPGSTLESSGTIGTSSSESWADLDDSRWVYSEDPIGKIEVPYRWRRVTSDGSSTYDVFGLKTEFRMIPGYIAWNNKWHNNRAELRHWYPPPNDDDDAFRFIEDYSPTGMTFGSTTTTVSLGWNQAGWSWSYTNPNVSIEQNGDTTQGELFWNIPDNDGDVITQDARNSTLTWEPGSSWRYNQFDICTGSWSIIDSGATCEFNQDGNFVDSTDSFVNNVTHSYDTGDCTP